MQIKPISSQQTKDNPLNFQNMELTSVHHDCGQLFQRSDVVHIISVQPHEVRCFIASADKKLNIRSERRTKLTHIIWYKPLGHVGYLCALEDRSKTCNDIDSRRQLTQKNSCNSSGLFAIGTWHINWWLALLGQVEEFFVCAGQNEYFVLVDRQWFLLESITSTDFFLDFHVALPKRPDLGNASTNPLPIICWWCWCCLSMAGSPSKPAEISLPLIYHLLLYTTTNITPCCCHITPCCCLISVITPIFWYII